MPASTDRVAEVLLSRRAFEIRESLGERSRQERRTAAATRAQKCLLGDNFWATRSSPSGSRWPDVSCHSSCASQGKNCGRAYFSERQAVVGVPGLPSSHSAQ